MRQLQQNADANATFENEHPGGRSCSRALRHAGAMGTHVRRARPAAERRTSGSLPGTAPFLVKKSFRQNSHSGNQEFMRDPKLLFCRKNIWNQGKAGLPSPARLILFCRKNIWNQGKAVKRHPRQGQRILPKEHLESRQSDLRTLVIHEFILPKEHLESRQSMTALICAICAILPKEHLESRQSTTLNN